MRNAFLPIVFAGCLLGNLSQAGDGPAGGWSIDELSANAQIICTGTPIKFVISDQKGEIHWLSNAPLPTRTIIATIKILGTTKGTVAQEIEIRYSNFDWDAMKAKGIHGLSGVGIFPNLVDLAIGKRYRFYLNPVPNQAWYVSAYPIDYEAGFAIHELGINEKDTDPPLLENEAINLATQYLQQKRPAFKINPKWIMTRFDPYTSDRIPRWVVQFDEQYPLKYPAFTYGAEIVVDSDRTIDSDSWIAIDPAPTDPKELVGKFVRVLYQPPNDGGMYIVRGHIERVAHGQMTLGMSKSDIHFQPDIRHPVDRMEIAPAQMKGVSVLLE